MNDECAWCGAELTGYNKPLANRRGEVFCTKYHRTSSNAALKLLIDKCEPEPEPKSDPFIEGMNNAI